MLVLQECSICYFDFSSERSPHCIPCGHVFCRECLVTALDHSERCPICRDPCLPEEIRKVVCSEDAPSTPPQESEDEKQMWKAIVDATEPGKEYEQRKAAFKNDLEPTLYGENNLNPNLFAAANLMKMLVRAERRNRQLETKLNAAKAAEQELREQVQTFEAESNRSQFTRSRNARIRTKPVTLYDFGGASDQVTPINMSERTRTGACSKYDECDDCVYCKNERAVGGYMPKGYLGYA